MPPSLHNDPFWKSLRTASQGINATTKGSTEKSKRRHKAKALHKAKKVAHINRPMDEDDIRDRELETAY